MKTSAMLTAMLCGLILAATPVARAQEGPPPVEQRDVEPGELRQALRTYFENRLRRELALSDEQVAAIVPRIRRLEQGKVDLRREKMETVRRLTRGLESGASDAELQRDLDRLGQLDADEQTLERKALAEVDADLSARQRVQLRFFLQRFRRDLAERMHDLGRDRPARRFPPGPRR